MAQLDFTNEIKSAYSFTGKSIQLGAAVYEKQCIKEAPVCIPLATLNRHGLIAGATGTGKTKSIQRLAEALSENGVNVLLMDIKGDISGIAQPGKSHPKITERAEQMGISWEPIEYPVELLTISDEKGARLRATISEFGPVLLSKILELNDNQQGTLAVLFKYCDDKNLPLLDLNDLRAVLQHIGSEQGKKELEENYGTVTNASTGVIMRKLLELEQQGGDKFFGERSFEVEDLLQKSKDGKAFVNILRLMDIQDRPRLFSTFMLCLLAEVYSKFPETGDKGEPKLVIFIDEAHLIFREASNALLQQLETVIKLIRSKGVGIFFCTQSPSDIPEVILGQLGSKIQHALRAFTAKDRKDIKLAAENFPVTQYYKTDELLTTLGIGEALVTVLNEKGIPTPLVHTLMTPPRSRMDVLTAQEQDQLIQSSSLARFYNEDVDRESAYEILRAKINTLVNSEKQDKIKTPQQNKPQPPELSGALRDIVNSSLTRTIARELTRGLMGVLLGTQTRRRK